MVRNFEQKTKILSIEAIQWDGNNRNEISDFTNSPVIEEIESLCSDPTISKLNINRHGLIVKNIGDWVVKEYLSNGGQNLFVLIDSKFQRKYVLAPTKELLEARDIITKAEKKASDKLRRIQEESGMLSTEYLNAKRLVEDYFGDAKTEYQFIEFGQNFKPITEIS